MAQRPANELTALFSHICFYITAENRCQGWLPAYACGFFNAIPFADLMVLTLKEYRSGQERRRGHHQRNRLYRGHRQ